MTFFNTLHEKTFEQIVEVLRNGSLPHRLELRPEEDPNDMDTIGSLVDKLITVDLKMWHNQEQLYAIRRMSVEEFETRYDDDLPGLHETIKRCCDLNVQRSKLVDAIDVLVADISSGKREAEVFSANKTY